MAKRAVSLWLLVGASVVGMVALGWLIDLMPSGIGRAVSPTSSAVVAQAPSSAPSKGQVEKPAGISLSTPPAVREETVYQRPIDANENPAGHAVQRTAAEAARRFDQAVSMLHMRQYEYAVAALQRVIELAPESAQAHVNLGFAYLGLERIDEAQRAFQTAMHLRPEQANAYYGLAITHESQGDLEAAMGAMLVFLDFSEGTAEENVYIRRGRSALWEWEAKLGDGPWGPTKGVPPGWSEEMLKRDGTGVGVYGMKRGENLQQAKQRREQEATARQDAATDDT